MTSTHMLRTRTPHCKKHIRVLTRNAIMHGNHAPHTSFPLLAAHKDAPLQEAHPRLDAQWHHTWQSCATHKLSTASCSKSRYTRLRDPVAPLPWVSSSNTHTWVDNLQASLPRATALCQVPEQLPAADLQPERRTAL